MSTINLPDVVIKLQADGRVQITHRKTGMVTESTLRKLNSWAISQLRKELVVQPVQHLQQV
jgi:hypothetical protein